MATIQVDPDEVRRLYGPDYTDKQAPNHFIQGDGYAGRAVREVKRRVPDWETFAAYGEEETRLRSAANHLTAAYSIRAIPNLTAEDHEGEGGLRREPLDVNQRRAELFAAADAEIAVVAGTYEEKVAPGSAWAPVELVW